MGERVRLLFEGEKNYNTIGFVVPYLEYLNKNKKYVARGNKCLSSRYRNALSYVEFALKECLKNQPRPKKGKCLVDIIIYRPHMRGDPINFIDGICDGMIKCLDFDDRWFTVRLDWELDKKRPHIDVRFTYEY